MSEHKWPRPVAWEGWHATITGERPRGALPGFVDVQEYEANEPGRDYSMTPDEAEAHAHALIMAAAVARGEHGHTAALNRVAVALGTGARPDELPGVVRDAVADLRAVLCDVDDAEAHYIDGQAPWWLIARAAAILRGMREDLAAVEVARAEAAQEATRLRAALKQARIWLSDAYAVGPVEDYRAVLAMCDSALAASAHDTAAEACADCEARLAEVVAPLREALKVGDLDPSTLSPADVVSHTLFRLGLRESAKPTREPMTHTSLASIEEHGVVVGDRLECVVGKTPRDPLSGFAVEAIRMRAALALLGVLVRDAAGRRQSPAFDDLAWPLTVVEAPDAD